MSEDVVTRLARLGFATLDHRPSLDLYLIARVDGDVGPAPDGRPGAWVVGLDLAGALARSYVNHGARRWGVVENLPALTLGVAA